MGTPDTEKIKHFIRLKINQYLKNKAYSSAKLREKLLLLPLKYPNHYYYPYYSQELVDAVIKEMEADGAINNELFINEIYESLSRRSWSNQKIWDYLQYNLLFKNQIIEELKDANPDRDESLYLKEIIRKLNIKITKWQRKLDDYELQQKIRQELYKDKWLTETIELILEEIKNN